MDYLFKGRLGHSWGHHEPRQLVWGGHTATGQTSGVGVGMADPMPPQYDPGTPETPLAPISPLSPYMQGPPRGALPEPERDANGFFTGRPRQ